MVRKKGIIGFVNKPAAKGGPGAFQNKLEKFLRENGWQVVYPWDKITPDVILVLVGTRRLFWLLKSKFLGAEIIYRLGGIVWLYRHKSSIPFFNKLLTTYKLWALARIQKVIGDKIIYQSEFSKEWLLKFGQSARIKNNSIIHNGVDTEIFKPQPDETGTTGGISLICVEGNLDYTPYAISLLNYLQESLVNANIVKQIILYGDFEEKSNRDLLHRRIIHRGLIPRDNIPSVYRKAVYLSLDINAACPNSLLEALSSGLPVVGFDTGSLKELVPAEAGIIVPYSGDPWKLDTPDFSAIADAVKRVIPEFKRYSEQARLVAVTRYSANEMTRRYLDVLLQTKKLRLEN